MSERLTLCLPVDVFLTQFDSTVTQTQLGNNTVLGSADDRDTMRSLIEDAESEFHDATSAELRLSRAGTPGDVETYEQQTYGVDGHEAFKHSWARTARDYRPTEANINLDNGRILPFDPDEGDEVRVYRGMDSTPGQQWEDVTDDEGDLWTILNHRDGVLALHPVEIHRAMVGSTNAGVGLGSKRRNVRIAISYRYGTLGGSRSAAGATDLSAALDDSETGTVGVTDASRLPGGGAGGSYVMMIGEEYVSATADVESDEIRIIERGIRGTQATAHDSEDRVQYTPPSIRKAVAARAGMAMIQSGRYKSWLPDSDDDLDSSDVLDRMEATWTRTVEALS